MPVQEVYSYCNNKQRPCRFDCRIVVETDRHNISIVFSQTRSLPNSTPTSAKARRRNNQHKQFDHSTRTLKNDSKLASVILITPPVQLEDDLNSNNNINTYHSTMSNMNESVEQALNKRPLKEKEDQPTTVVGRTAKIPKSAAGGNSNSNRRSKKPRRAMPEMKDFLPDDEQDPSLADVVGGRGGRSNHHPGNRPYWVKILAARDLYRSCASDHAKTQIASRIKDHVQQTLGGRFLNLDDATKKWFLLPDSVILDKVRLPLLQ